MSVDECKLESFKIYAVVPAAGQSQRMGKDVPKQYMRICGIPLVAHCLRGLSAPPWMQKVFVVVDDIENYSNYLKDQDLPKVIPIQGGKSSRHQSIFEGLKALENDNPDVVVIHDGARPIVPRQILAQVILKATEVGAAGVVRPLVSTVVRPDSSSFLEETLQRSLYRNSEMPQAFRYAMILQSYKKCTEEILESGTECLLVAQKFGGVDAFLVEGSSDLWKVTYPQDIETAKYFLPKYCLRIMILCCECPAKRSHNSDNDFRHYDAPNIETKSSVLPLQDYINLESSRLTNKDESSSHCGSIPSTLEAISSCILRNSLSSDVVSDVKLLETNFEYLLSISCLKTISDAENLLNAIKGRLQPKKHSIITIFNAPTNLSLTDIFLPLRQTMAKLFPFDNIVAIVCQRDCTNTQHDSQHNSNRNQLTLMIEQCLKSPLMESLRGQVLFL